MTVYLITNLKNGKRYVGQTINSLCIRWAQHKCQAMRYSRGFPLYHAIRKYGPENFNISILDTANSMEELNRLEEFHINALGTVAPSGYNVYRGGFNYSRSEETRAKISKAKKGKPSWAKGRVWTPEQRAKLSAAISGRKLSDEHKANISRGGKGRIVSEKTRKEISLRLKGRPSGIIPSEETRKKMRESKIRAGIKPPIIIGRIVSQETREKLRANAMAYWAKRKLCG